MTDSKQPQQLSEHSRFRKQYTEKEWSRLDENLEFKEALAVDDLDKAGEVAARILIGETKSLPEARDLKKTHDTFKQFDD